MATTEQTHTPRSAPVHPKGFNHLVLHVRDLEESHAFWCDMLGFKQVGQVRPRPDRETTAKMRFYSGVQDDTVNHHDLALLEVEGLPMAPEWSMAGSYCAFNHLAITYPDRQAWLDQVQYLADQGALDNPLRVDHGMTHSLYVTDPNGYRIELLYDLPEEVWENDIDGALNYVEYHADDQIHVDDTNYPIFG